MFSHLFLNKPQNLFLIHYLLQFLFEQKTVWEHFLDQRSCIHIVRYAVLVLFFFITVESFPSISNRLKTYTRNWTDSRIASIKTEN